MIHILNAHTTQQIAAGEVIDNPSSILRELLDNSIDAGATFIEVSIQAGGIDRIKVSDNGTGMSKEDLLICCKPHATSKISTFSDLQYITSMGFRGEALASISAVSKTTIISYSASTSTSHKITVENNTSSLIEPFPRNKGTSITVEKLFHTIPARKKFLASPSTEKKRIQSLLAIKAAAFPHISFVLKEDATIVTTFPIEDAFNRAVRITHTKNTRVFLWHDEVKDSSTDMTLSAAIGIPDIAIKSKRHIHIYINNRNVKDYNLVQAIEYAYKNTLHMGLSPQIVLFLHIPTDTIDINIHPTKQEIKIKNIAQVRSFIITTISNILASYSHAHPKIEDSDTMFSDAQESTSKNIATTDNTLIPQKHTIARSNNIQNYSIPKTTYYEVHASKEQYAPSSSYSHSFTKSDYNATTRSQSYNFIGSVFGTYALFEKECILLFLDFHATHEKKIYDSLKEHSTPQPLLIPIPIHFSLSEDDIEILRNTYKKIGILIEKTIQSSMTSYTLFAIPSTLFLNPDAIAHLIEHEESIHTIDVDLFASKACKAAARAGDHIDAEGAVLLLEYALNLEVPRCPHGRPLWIEINKHALDSKIGRK